MDAREVGGCPEVPHVRVCIICACAGRSPVANVLLVVCDAQAQRSAVSSQIVIEKANQQGMWSNDI